MIRGHFDPRAGSVRRPVIDGALRFPSLDIPRFNVRFLVDTGADRTTLSPRDAIRLSQRFDINIADLPQSIPTQGVGGQHQTRILDAQLSLDNFSFDMQLTILEPQTGQPSAIPSLLGRDVISHFALFMELRTERVLLLTHDEADGLNLAN